MIRKRIIAAVPMISVLLFLAAGLYLDDWQLGWTFFLLIPVSWIFLVKNPLKRVNEIMPLICLILFLWLGFGLEAWHPGWLVFLLVPVVNLIVEKKMSLRRLVSLIVIGGYIAIGLITEDWHPNWIMLLLIPIINTIFFPQKEAFISFNSQTMKKQFRNIVIEPDDEEDE